MILNETKKSAEDQSIDLGRFLAVAEDVTNPTDSVPEDNLTGAAGDYAVFAATVQNILRYLTDQISFLNQWLEQARMVTKEQYTVRQ